MPAIEELFESLKLKGTFNLTSADLSSPTPTRGGSQPDQLATATTNRGILVSSKATLFDWQLPETALDSSGQATLEGSIKLVSPIIKLDIDITGFKLKRFKADMGLRMTSDVGIKLNAEIAETQTIFKKELRRFDIPIPSIPGLSLSFPVSFTLQPRASAALTLGLTSEASLDLTATVEDGNVTTENRSSMLMNLKPPTVDSFVESQITAHLGAFFNFDANLRLARWYDLFGLKGKHGAEATIEYMIKTNPPGVCGKMSAERIAEYQLVAYLLGKERTFPLPGERTPIFAELPIRSGVCEDPAQPTVDATTATTSQNIVRVQLGCQNQATDILDVEMYISGLENDNKYLFSGSAKYADYNNAPLWTTLSGYYDLSTARARVDISTIGQQHPGQIYRRDQFWLEPQADGSLIDNAGQRTYTMSGYQNSCMGRMAITPKLDASTPR